MKIKIKSIKEKTIFSFYLVEIPLTFREIWMKYDGVYYKPLYFGYIEYIINSKLLSLKICNNLLLNYTYSKISYPTTFLEDNLNVNIIQTRHIVIKYDIDVKFVKE